MMRFYVPHHFMYVDANEQLELHNDLRNPRVTLLDAARIICRHDSGCGKICIFDVDQIFEDFLKPSGTFHIISMVTKQARLNTYSACFQNSCQTRSSPPCKLSTILSRCSRASRALSLFSGTLYTGSH